MPTPRLRTRLLIPPVRRGLVSRPRLVDLPEGASTVRLMLVSAPPGFGKTTLLASWADAAASAGHAVGWVSLEESDRSPASSCPCPRTRTGRLGSGRSAPSRARITNVDPKARPGDSWVWRSFRALAALRVFQPFIDHQRFVHTFVSNVRGPSTSLSFAGREVDRVIPVAVTPGNVGVSFEVLSYAGRLTITVIADPDVLAEQDRLTTALAEELGSLCAASP